MRSMCKRLLIASAISLFMAGNALALPMTDDWVRMGYDWHSPYTLTDLNDLNDPNDDVIYASFCLEYWQEFTPGGVYKVGSAADYADGGGWGAVAGKDPVEEESKWLYAAYMSGAFDKVDNNANKVQQAIWFLEKEYGGSQEAWNELKDIEFDASGWEFVAVNLTNKNGNKDDNKDYQSQLVGVKKVPEASSMLLLGTGLVALAGLGRRRLIK